MDKEELKLKLKADAQSNAPIKLDFNKVSDAPLVSNLINEPVYIINLDEWRKNKQVVIKRANPREVTTPDLTTAMIKRECGLYSTTQIRNGTVTQREGAQANFSPQSYQQYLLDPNNMTAQQRNNPVNVNAAGTRCFICQADATITKQAIRFMYCSNDENLRAFAAKFVEDTPENRQQAAAVSQQLYDPKTNDFYMGEGAVEGRYAACKDMKKITLKNIDKNGKLSDTFISELEKFGAQHHELLLNAKKDFVVAIYPFDNKKNIPAANAQTSALKKGWRDASCQGIGTASLYTASLIAKGA